MDKKKWFHRPKKKHAMPGERERRKKLLHLLAGIVAVAAVLFLSVTAWRHYQTSRAEQFQNRLDAVQNGASGSFEQISPDTPLYVLVIGRDGNTPQQVNFVGLAAVNKEKKHIDFIMLPDNTKIEGRKVRRKSMPCRANGSGAKSCCTCWRASSPLRPFCSCP